MCIPASMFWTRTGEPSSPGLHGWTRTSIRGGLRSCSEDTHSRISGKTSPPPLRWLDSFLGDCWCHISSLDNEIFLATEEGSGTQEGDATGRPSQYSTRRTLLSTLRRWLSWSRSWGRWKLPWYISTSARSQTTGKMAIRQSTGYVVIRRRNGWRWWRSRTAATGACLAYQIRGMNCCMLRCYRQARAPGNYERMVTLQHQLFVCQSRDIDDSWSSHL